MFSNETRPFQKNGNIPILISESQKRKFLGIKFNKNRPNIKLYVEYGKHG